MILFLKTSNMINFSNYLFRLFNGDIHVIPPFLAHIRIIIFSLDAWTIRLTKN